MQIRKNRDSRQLGQSALGSSSLVPLITAQGLRGNAVSHEMASLLAQKRLCGARSGPVSAGALSTAPSNVHTCLSSQFCRVLLLRSDRPALRVVACVDVVAHIRGAFTAQAVPSRVFWGGDLHWRAPREFAEKPSRGHSCHGS